MTQTPNNTANPQTIDAVLQATPLTLETTDQIKRNFIEFMAEAEKASKTVFAIEVTDVSQVTLMAEAKEARKILVKLRNDADKKRKELKADSIAYGRAVEAVYNKIESIILPMEEHLKKQEKFAENKLAEERAARMAIRNVVMERYKDYMPKGVDFSVLEDVDFENILNGAKAQYELAEKQKVEAERLRKEEEERLAKQKQELEQAAAELEKEKERMRLAAAELEKERLRQEQIAAENQKQLEEMKAKLTEQSSKPNEPTADISQDIPSESLSGGEQPEKTVLIEPVYNITANITLRYKKKTGTFRGVTKNVAYAYLNQLQIAIIVQSDSPNMFEITFMDGSHETVKLAMDAAGIVRAWAERNIINPLNTTI